MFNQLEVLSIAGDEGLIVEFLFGSHGGLAISGGMFNLLQVAAGDYFVFGNGVYFMFWFKLWSRNESGVEILLIKLNGVDVSQLVGGVFYLLGFWVIEFVAYVFIFVC